MARPLKKIDEKALHTMAISGCTYAEMAAALGTTPELLHRRFEAEIELARGNFKTTLRRKQMQQALKGSVPMLIHLGKHELGQVELNRVALTNPTGDKPYREMTNEELLQIIQDEQARLDAEKGTKKEEKT